MVAMQIIVFKCKVNICNQDLGAFCREWDLGGKKKIGEEQGATEQNEGRDLEGWMEVAEGLGWVGWGWKAVLVVAVVGGWFYVLVTLLGRLWWRWEWDGHVGEEANVA